MSGNTDFTTEALTALARSCESEKRFSHSQGVALTTQRVLERYSCAEAMECVDGVKAGWFCGMMHDLAREIPDAKAFSMCKERGLRISASQTEFPVFLHGMLASSLISEMFPQVPEKWLRAIDLHTIGDRDMDDLALALFIADFIEPGRTYLTDSQREAYMALPTIRDCAHAILCDIMSHQASKGNKPVEESVRMRAWLEEKKR